MITDQQIADTKAAHPSVELHLVEVGDAAFIVRRPSSDEYAAYWEETDGKVHAGFGADSVAAAENNLALACSVFPSPAEIGQAIEAAPAILKTLVEEIAELAGQTVESMVSSLELEAEHLTDEDRAILSGASITMRPTDRFMRGPEGVIVFGRPSRAVWESCRAARIGKPLRMETVRQLNFDCVRYPSAEALKSLYEKVPALAPYHHVALRRMAGVDLEARKKRI